MESLKAPRHPAMEKIYGPKRVGVPTTRQINQQASATSPESRETRGNVPADPSDQEMAELMAAIMGYLPDSDSPKNKAKHEVRTESDNIRQSRELRETRPSVTPSPDTRIGEEELRAYYQMLRANYMNAYPGVLLAIDPPFPKGGLNIRMPRP